MWISASPETSQSASWASPFVDAAGRLKAQIKAQNEAVQQSQHQRQMRCVTSLDDIAPDERMHAMATCACKQTTESGIPAENLDQKNPDSSGPLCQRDRDRWFKKNQQ
ncbi:hypothetical protein Pan14r_02090 [Crateriforma conspicua]|uniref:Uncharacterized protein n=1 Tax=Crateriforma conspicua TaxID=2527996 RepID=A0A5C5XZW1_9PLAN|nr:hypothetical protein Pan14r_02090 [Crateriforma conspicua]